jgi:alpha-N-arabinofuranosidase
MRITPFVLLASLALGASGAFAADASLVLRADQPGAVINRNIYGHFSEHHGRCIY